MDKKYHFTYQTKNMVNGKANIGKKQCPISVSKRIKIGTEHYRYGKSPSDECKLKISNTLKGRFTGKENHAYIGDIYQINLQTKQCVGTYHTAKQASEKNRTNGFKNNRYIKRGLFTDKRLLFY